MKPFLRILFLLVLLVPLVRAQADNSNPAEKLYREGILPSGQLLHGDRDIGVPVDGAEAACANCHRRSGLGTLEGRILIPPITAKYLFRTNGSHGLEDMDFRFGTGVNAHRDPYNEITLARAIREGVGKEDQPLGALMPHYQIDDATMASLVAYLTNLSADTEPGVTNDTLHFATIITPDADPVKRKGMLDVLNQFFDDKNEFLRGGRRIVQSSVHVKYRVTRSWKLHVWDLTGPSESWESQLRQHQADEPVFAIISGLGGRTWAPIHHFCEDQAIPCILPNVDLPVVQEKDYYSIYFNKGVLLEARLIANVLHEQENQAAMKRVVQIYRDGDIGADAAKEFVNVGGAAGLQSIVHKLKAGSGKRELDEILKHTSAGDVIILWLRPEELKGLPNAVAKNYAVYISGLMGGLENAPLPQAWRKVAHMAYPLDSPESRKARMNFPLGWLKIRKIPLVDELTQANTYLACGIMAETITEMLDSFVRNYMIERIESMVSYRTVTGHYPRLGLAPEQRFASKGGFIMHFADSDSMQLKPETEWIVP